MLPQWLKKGFLAMFQPVVGWFVALNVKPNWLTTAGFA